MRKLSVKWEPDYWREHNLPDNGCFGYVNGHLVLGRAHHQLIMGNFIYKGWTMEQLLMAPQAWGWFTVNKISYYPEYFPNYDKMKDWQKSSSFIVAQFTSDAGIQVDEEVTAAMGAFSAMYHLPTKLSRDAKVRGVVEENFATGLRGIHNMDKYLEKPEYYFGEDFVGNNPHVLHGVPQPPESDWNPEWSESAIKPEDQNKQEQPKPPKVKPSLTLKGDFSQYNVGDKIKVIYEGWNNIETITQVNPHDVHAVDENGVENVWSQPSSIQKLAPEGDELYGIYDLKGDVKTKLDYKGPDDAYWINDQYGTKHKVHDLSLIPKWIEEGQIIKREQPFSGYEGVYLNSLHPETSNHLHVTPDSATWKHPQTGAVVGDSVLTFDSLKKNIDDGKLIKTEPDLGGFYEGNSFSVHYDGVKNKATWTYPGGTQIGPSYVSPIMVKKYIDEGSWNLVTKDNFKEPKTVIGPNMPLDGPQVGDKFYYTPDMEKENPQVYTVSEVSPNEIIITWPKMISPDGVTYDPETFNKVFTKASSLSKEAYTPGGKTKGWGDIMEKANYIRSQNGVNIINNEPQHVTGTVMSATDPQNRGPYNTEIWRDDPQSQAITMWDCDCDWDQYAWGRTRQWKKYEGRPCCHVLAMFWDALSNPPAGAQTAPGTPAAPPTPVPGGGVTVNQGLIAPMGQPPIPNVPLIGPEGEPAPISPAPAPGGPTNPAALPWSEVVQPGKGEGTITFPGTFSHWKEAARDGYYDDPEYPQPQLTPDEARKYLEENQQVAFMYFDGRLEFGWNHYSIMNHLMDNGEDPKDLYYQQPIFGNIVNKNNSLYVDWYSDAGKDYFSSHFQGEAHLREYAKDALEEALRMDISGEADTASMMIKEPWKEAGSYENFIEGLKNLPEVTSDENPEAESPKKVFQNGDIVRTWEETQGTIPPAWGQPEYLPVTIKKNQSGEVLYSDENTTVAIFPLSTGPLEPHLVKVECPTKNLYLDNTNAQPFVKKH